MNEIYAHQVMSAIRSANYHHPGLRCACLLRLDAGFFEQVQQEVARLCEVQQPSNVQDPGHITNWTRPSGQVLQYSLLNATGRYDDFSSDHGLSVFGKRFRDAAQYPALARLIEGFPHATNFRINVMGPDATLAPHEEHSIVRTQLGTVGVRPRFHLPVVSTPGAELVLDGDVYHLDEGAIYFVNHGCFHLARNRADRPRTHLVWDMLLTRETFALMFADGPDISFPACRVSPGEQQMVPLRTERMGPVRRLPAPVPESEAGELAFFELQ